MHLPVTEQLCNCPPLFPGVTPFRGRPPHTLNIVPHNQQLAATFHIPALAICSKATRFLPSADIPLGYIKYSFAHNLARVFAAHSLLIRNAFTGSLCVLETVDFLDGRNITTYGYLDFSEHHTFVVDQGYHCEDAVRVLPHLLAYTFVPRIPADPFAHVTVHPDNLPLS